MPKPHIIAYPAVITIDQTTYQIHVLNTKIKLIHPPSVPSAKFNARQALIDLLNIKPVLPGTIDNVTLDGHHLLTYLKIDDPNH